jgi:hypothetical protein
MYVNQKQSLKNFLKFYALASTHYVNKKTMCKKIFAAELAEVSTGLAAELAVSI